MRGEGKGGRNFLISFSLVFVIPTFLGGGGGN